jgi:hypothetical protein
MQLPQQPSAQVQVLVQEQEQALELVQQQLAQRRARVQEQQPVLVQEQRRHRPQRQ